MAVPYVIAALKALGSTSPTVRCIAAGDAASQMPMKTDQDFFIVMAPFPPLLTSKDPVPAANATGQTPDGQTGRLWHVGKLAEAIKLIPGVLDVGIFTGVNGPEAQAAGGQGGQKPIAAYFGMEDGSVKVRKAAIRA